MYIAGNKIYIQLFHHQICDFKMQVNEMLAI